jgi:chromosomal replication initiation ATPase DnaA
MPEITYKVVQKPVEERLIDAACIYWGVDRQYFSKASYKAESTVVYRKSVLYYLLKNNTIYSFKEIAGKFGFIQHGAVIKAVENIDAQKNVLKQVSNDINQIQHLSDKLDAEFIRTNINLVNNKLEIS